MIYHLTQATSFFAIILNLFAFVKGNPPIDDNSDGISDGMAALSDGTSGGIPDGMTALSDGRCAPLADIRHGTLSCLNGRLFGVDCRYTCEDRYVLDGSPVVTCSDSGQWMGEVPTCKIGECRPLPTLNKGSVTCTDRWNRKSHCFYSCNDGFSLKGGNFVLTCRGNGFWRGFVPTCERDTTAMPSTTSADVTTNDKAPTMSTTNKATAPTMSTTNKATAPTMSTTNKATAPTMSTTNKATAPTMSTNNKATAPIMSTTNKATARTMSTTNKATAPTMFTSNKATAPTMSSTNKATAPTMSTTNRATARTMSTTNKATAPTMFTSNKATAPTMSTTNKDTAPTMSTTNKDTAPTMSTTNKTTAPTMSTTDKATAPTMSTTNKATAPTMSTTNKAMVFSISTESQYTTIQGNLVTDDRDSGGAVLGTAALVSIIAITVVFIAAAVALAVCGFEEVPVQDTQRSTEPASMCSENGSENYLALLLHT